jgi:endonuclease YncB( thermonuclease family)
MQAAELAGGRVVECVIIGLDKYRRLLGTCSVLDATSKPDGPSLNERMVAAGFAIAYTWFSQAYVKVEDGGARRQAGPVAGPV